MPPLLLLLLFVLSWDRTSGQDGCDDKSCPPAPLVKTIPPGTAQYEYATSILSDSTSGETIYKCKSGALNLYSSPDESPSESSILVCKKDTGSFVRRYADGREVLVKETDEYVCREKLCPAVTTIESIATANSTFYQADGTLLSAKGEESTVASCPEFSDLFDLSNPADPKIVTPSNYPKCKRNSGVWTPNEKMYKCLKTPTSGLDQDDCAILNDRLRLVTGPNLEAACGVDPNQTFILRGIDANGNRITVDTDDNQRVSYDESTKLWIFKDGGTNQRENVNFKAVSCGISSGKCPCPLLPKLPDSEKNGVPGAVEKDFVCDDPTHGMWYYVSRSGRRQEWLQYVPNTRYYSIRCHAGIWIMRPNLGDVCGWEVHSATCFKP